MDEGSFVTISCSMVIYGYSALNSSMIFAKVSWASCFWWNRCMVTGSAEDSGAGSSLDGDAGASDSGVEAVPQQAESRASKSTAQSSSDKSFFILHILSISFHHGWLNYSRGRREGYLIHLA